MSKDFFLALSTLIGLTIGAGIFGIPYSILKSGIIPGLFYFFILGGVVFLIHALFGEIVLRTNEKQRLVGYAKKYLGQKAKILITFTTLIGISGCLLVYMILGGSFLKNLFPSFGFDEFYFSILFWLFLSVFVFIGKRFISKIEFFTNLFFFFILFLIFIFSFLKFDFQRIPLFSFDIFLPYGVILFSLLAIEAVPEAEEILKEKTKLKNVIFLNTLIVGLVYLLFSIFIIGVSGENTSKEALSGLSPFLGKRIVFFGLLAALITIADSFLVLAISLRNTLRYDFKIPKYFSSFLTTILPLILFLSGVRDFIRVIGFLGTFLGLVNGIAIVFIYKKAKTLGDKKPEYSLNLPNFILYLLIAILVLGTISNLYYEIHR
jgi:tyrosine-specific transport protein